MLPQHSFTTFGWLVCTWVLVVSFQYGYHISTLNQIQAVLTCKDHDPLTPYSYNLPTCILMSDATFSLLTSVFTVGGLLGSLSANSVMDRYGRKGAVQASSMFVAAGAALMTAASNVPVLCFGRMLTGVGAGIGLCVGPIFLSEIAPTRIKGSVGVLTQLAIVIGIMITQAMGLRLAKPTTWRIVLLFSCFISLAQLVISPFVTESPVWLRSKGGVEDVKKIEKRLWSTSEATFGPSGESPGGDAEAHDPLLEREADDENESEADRRLRIAHKQAPTVSFLDLVKSSELRRPLAIVCFAMTSQQLSGINAVLYYSNDILSKALPDLGPFVSLGITIVNAIMTFPPIFLIERLGRRTLLLLSVGGALVSLVLVGVGLDANVVSLASAAIMTFVMSFAIGLGPVPFVIIPEVSPSHAVGALSSVALSLNWIANFFVGLVFLPLRNSLSGGDPGKEGRVFYVFAAILVVTTTGMFRSYRG
ncbi:general substrate transporter [Stereum hirsutum FP-91666 SS1]|uniref:general substrate transporter n=1 Tax=Stereum hirsutum (strain FP-91666) TaxID=721885 RepID=UPI000444A922|nr:general substrate transporter [Stereum hirsutum FP-91666 SS1]EIM82522.1 general substrate transporter [Stereum hirsutum FP-91666 SS1]